MIRRVQLEQTVQLYSACMRKITAHAEWQAAKSSHELHHAPSLAPAAKRLLVQQPCAPPPKPSFHVASANYTHTHTHTHAHTHTHIITYRHTHTHTHTTTTTSYSSRGRIASQTPLPHPCMSKCRVYDCARHQSAARACECARIKTNASARTKDNGWSKVEKGAGCSHTQRKPDAHAPILRHERERARTNVEAALECWHMTVWEHTATSSCIQVSSSCISLSRSFTLSSLTSSVCKTAQFLRA